MKGRIPTEPSGAVEPTAGAVGGAPAALIAAAKRSMARSIASGAVHAASQPLSAIDAYVEVCRARIDKAGDSAQALVILDKIRDQARRAGDALRQLKSDFEFKLVRPETVDVNRLVEATVADFPSSATAGRVRLDLDGECPKCLADPVQLRLAVLCLIENALEATAALLPPPETVTIGTVAGEDGHVALTVDDRGPGLSPEAKRRLFEPLYSTKGGHLGLGLAQCQAIARAHGGAVRAQDRPGGGARLCLVIPAAPLR